MELIVHHFKHLFSQLPETYEENNKALSIHGSALETLKSINDDSINLIFADPPYNIGKDFGEGKSKMSDEEYIQWCIDWISECYRILSPDGTMYVMSATQYMPHLDIFVSKEYHVLSRIVWTYDSSGVQSKKYFGSLFEPILMVVKDKNNYTFNAEDIMVEAKTGSKRKLIDYRKTPPQPYNTKKVPGNVWDFPRVRYKMAEYENHPSQKPEALLERVILASSNEEDYVLDPFGGSFTTGAVAVKYNRKAISLDINKEYFKIGLRRMGICNEYNGELLERDLSRKTKNKSKQDHVKQQKMLD